MDRKSLEEAWRQLDLKGRGSGTTTRALQAAPQGAVYIWVNSDLRYPTELAHKLGRKDLKIVGPGWLTDKRYRGLKLFAVIRDHATTLTEEQWGHYFYLKERTRL